MCVKDNHICRLILILKFRLHCKMYFEENELSHKRNNDGSKVNDFELE